VNTERIGIPTTRQRVAGASAPSGAAEPWGSDRPQGKMSERQQRGAFTLHDDMRLLASIRPRRPAHYLMALLSISLDALKDGR
jgi:hypothetical protein